MQEYYRFPEVLPAVRNMIRLRYALLPYLYSEFMKAALENTSYFRPLASITRMTPMPGRWKISFCWARA